MPTHRRYTKRTKLAAVIAADLTSLTEASESSGVPKSTLKHWLDDPEMARIRTKTREDLADEVKVVSHLAWQRVAQALRTGEMEPRDAIFAAEKATSLQILMSGGATARTELRDITGSLDDADVLEAIRAAEDYTRPSDSGSPEAAEVPAEG
jgi:hypothetical protein